jgi:DNA polymerase III delta prime subunit
MEALTSRCIPIRFPAVPVKDIYERLVHIMKTEEVEFNKDDLKDITLNILKPNYPDIRATIEHLEMCCVSGKFRFVQFKSEEGQDKIAEYILEHLTQWKDCREYWIKNEVEFQRDYIGLAGKIFNKSKSPDEMLLIADHIYKMNLVLDKEIQFSAMVLELGNLKNEN